MKWRIYLLGFEGGVASFSWARLQVVPHRPLFGSIIEERNFQLLLDIVWCLCGHMEVVNPVARAPAAHYTVDTPLISAKPSCQRSG